jgi:hypothetical protein
MKTLRILILLIIISLQASATGYVHNMFVAHRKLQSGKECVTERAVAKKGKPALKAKAVHVRHAGVIKNTSAAIPEGPAAFFESESEESEGESMVTKLVSAVRCVIYTFIPRLGNS